MAADEAGARWMPVPQSLIFPGYWGNKPKWVVVHKTGGPGNAEQQAQFFAGSANVNKASTHYVIGQDGEIVQCVSEADGAGGNCCLEDGHASFLPTGINLNLLTISIEHCDPSLSNSTAVTPAQQQASFRLIQHICQRNGIPMRPGDANGGIIGHYQIAAQSRKQCPGNYPWEALWAFLKGNGSMIPDGWSDDGTTLTASNGVKIVAGFRTYILANNWDAEDVPLGEEYAVDSVLLHNSAVGPGSRLLCKKSYLWWTKALGVHKEPYTAWELDAAYKALTAQIASIPNLSSAEGLLQDALSAAGVITTSLTKASGLLKQ